MQNNYVLSTPLPPDVHYNHHSAEEAVNFIKYLCLYSDHQERQFSVPIKWQERFLRDVFGAKTSNGSLQFICTYIATLEEKERLLFSIRIALLLTCTNRAPYGEVYYYVSNQQQATTLFNFIFDTVERCKGLHRYIKPFIYQKKLVYKPLNSFIQVITPEEFKLTQNVHGVFLDELYIHNNFNYADFKNTVSQSVKNRPLFVITASSVAKDKSKFFYLLHQKANSILAGTHTDSMFYPTIIYKSE